MSSRGGGRSRGSGRSGSGRSGSGRGLIESPPPSTDRQPTPVDDNDQDTPMLSEQLSQTGSTCSVGMMYIYRTESGDLDFANTGSTSRVISAMLKARITSFWPCFSKVPSSVKDHWFNEFKSVYTWIPTTSFADVRRLWETKCSSKYRYTVSEMKRTNKKSDCITDEVWQQFLAYWERQDVKDLAEKNSVARNKNPRPHRCGSKPMAQWMNDMEKDLGRIPTYMEVYVRTHYVEKPDGSEEGGWINDHAEQFVMKYNEQVAQMTESEGRELSHNELNLLYIQHTKEGETSASSRSTRRPGTGNIPGIYRDNAYSATSRVSDDRKKLLEEVQDLRTKNEELRGTMNKITDQMSDVQEYISRLRQERGEE